MLKARVPPKFRVIRVTPRRVIRRRISSAGRSEPAIAVDVVRLDLLVTERWVTPDFRTRGKLRTRVAGVWERYAAAVEADYPAGRPVRSVGGTPGRAPSAPCYTHESAMLSPKA